MLRTLLSVTLIVLCLGSFANADAAQTKKKAATPAASGATTAKPSATLIDLNTATKAELMTLPGIGDVLAGKIMSGRPYQRKDQLVSKKVIPSATYDKIKDQVIARNAPK